MTTLQSIASRPVQVVRHRLRTMIAGALAVAATLTPAVALGMDLFPKPDVGAASLLLPPVLKPTPWMGWKPAPPLLKTDTLLAPGNVPEKDLRIPFEYERTLPRIS